MYKSVFKNQQILLSFVFLAGCLSCTPKKLTELTKASLIPIPVSIEATGDIFELGSTTVIHTSSETKKPGAYLADLVAPATGFDLQVVNINSNPQSGIYLNLITNTQLGEEGYELNITPDLVTLSAQTPTGIFRGIQTLRQLLPASIESSAQQDISWEIATGKIVDYPEYEYRGSMLDVARHFFSVEDVKRYIDLIAAYKMNTLHLHLTDDQGWRIEIKSWPNLTEHGSKTAVGGGAGGFYTQEEFKEIVSYAADRFILIIPEIDVPSHTNAALASYPELNCNNEKPDLYTGIEVGFCTVCTDKEVTYQFVDDVVRELAAITPGPYIHLGGDESHVTPMEDYINFFNRVQKIVQANGKQMIGWEEIGHVKLDSTTIVQYWNTREPSIETSISQGNKIILSPADRSYLDMQYDSTTHLGLHWAAYVEVDQSYNWNPEELVTGLSKNQILGVEAPLWSETITTMNEIEYLMFPRVMGIAEIGWSSPSRRKWESYKVRLGQQATRLKAMEIDYYESKLVPWGDNKKTN